MAGSRLNAHALRDPVFFLRHGNDGPSLGCGLWTPTGTRPNQRWSLLVPSPEGSFSKIRSLLQNSLYRPDSTSPAIGVKIQSGDTKFLWGGRLERPPPGAIYRPTNDGGLAMFHTDLFLKALFLRPIAMALLGQDSSVRFLLWNWLVFPTRHFLHLYKVTPATAALFQRPAHMETGLQHLRMILANGSPLPQPLTHRRIYTRLLVSKFTSGHIELAQPQLDREAIWRSAKFLPPATRESQFLFNQRLLFTRDRCNEIDPRVDPVSDRCHIEIETAVHLMTGCFA